MQTALIALFNARFFIGGYETEVHVSSFVFVIWQSPGEQTPHFYYRELQAAQHVLTCLYFGNAIID